MVKLQTEYINNKLFHKCDDSLKNRRDFLHIAVEVMKYKIITQDFSGAQDILDSMSDCRFLCEDTNNLNECSCGCM